MSHANLPVAVHVILMQDNKVLLLRRKNTGLNDNKWSLPAGRLEEGESFTVGAIREAEEEVGVKIEAKDLEKKLIMQHHDERGERIYCFFLCREWENEAINCELDKCSEVAWFDIDSLPEETIDHIQIAIKEILKGSTYLEFGF